MASQIHLVFFIIGTTVFWLVYHTQYRECRILYLRERLFEIRDSLFQDAKNGKLSFDDEAYGLIRLTLNGMIRFAHELSFGEVLLAVVYVDIKRKDAVAGYKQQWETAYEKLSDEGKEIVDEARMTMHIYMMMHIVKSSVILHSLGLVVYWSVVLAEKIVTFVHKTDGRIRENLQSGLLRQSKPVQDVVDLQAINIGRDVHRRAVACEQITA